MVQPINLRSGEDPTADLDRRCALSRFGQIVQERNTLPTTSNSIWGCTFCICASLAYPRFNNLSAHLSLAGAAQATGQEPCARGGLGLATTVDPALEAVARFIVLRGFWVPEITLDPTRLERGKRFVTDGLADGSLKPIIAKTFPLEEIVEAHRYLESNQQIGKVVVTV